MRLLIIALLLTSFGCATYQESPLTDEVRARSDARYGEPEKSGRFLTWFDSLFTGGTSGSFGSFNSFDNLNTGCTGPVIMGRCHGQPMPGGDTFIKQPNSPDPPPPPQAARKTTNSKDSSPYRNSFMAQLPRGPYDSSPAILGPSGGRRWLL